MLLKIVIYFICVDYYVLFNYSHFIQNIIIYNSINYFNKYKFLIVCVCVCV